MCVAWSSFYLNSNVRYKLNMITNENEFLGFIIEHCDKNGFCSKLVILDGLDGNKMELLDYIKDASIKGYIQDIGINELRITNKGKNYYTPNEEVIEKITINTTKRFVYFLLDILKIVLGGCIGSFLTHYFGW